MQLQYEDEARYVELQKKIYIIADIILSFQYMIYTEDKDSSTYTRFWLSKKRKKNNSMH